MEARNLYLSLKLAILACLFSFAGIAQSVMPFSLLPLETASDTTNDRIVYLHWNGSAYVNAIIKPGTILKYSVLKDSLIVGSFGILRTLSGSNIVLKVDTSKVITPYYFSTHSSLDSSVVPSYGLKQSISGTKKTFSVDTTSGAGSSKVATEYFVKSQGYITSYTDTAIVGNADIGVTNAIPKVVSVKSTVVKSVVLNTPNVIFSTPITFTTATNTATGTLSLNTQTANYGFFGATSGGAATPTFRAMVSADIPSGIVSNSSLANSSTTINGTSIALGASGTVTAAAGTLTGTTLNSTVVSSSLTSVGTIGTGTWQGTVISPTYGGTGVNNGSNTITLAGSLTHTGAYASTFAMSGAYTYTMPPVSAQLVAQLGTQAAFQIPIYADANRIRSENWFFADTVNKRIKIGSSNAPLLGLDVGDNDFAMTLSGVANFRMLRSMVGTASYYGFGLASAKNMMIAANPNLILVAKDGNTEMMRLDSLGNTNIGTYGGTQIFSNSFFTINHAINGALIGQFLNPSSSTTSRAIFVVGINSSAYLNFQSYATTYTSTTTFDQAKASAIVSANGNLNLVTGASSTSIGQFINSVQIANISSSGLFVGGSTASTYKLDVSGGDLGLMSIGSCEHYHMGSSGDMAGTATLVAGVATITISGLTSTAIAQGVDISISGRTTGVSLTYSCTSNTLTITSVNSLGVTDTGDVSTVNYKITKKS